MAHPMLQTAAFA